MTSFEIKTYSDMEDWKIHHEYLAQCNSEEFIKFDITNICNCELYQNKHTGDYALLITRDLDEAWLVFKFE